MEERPKRTLKLVNSKKVAITVILEPWGDEYPISPGREVHLIDSGGEDTHPLEMHLEEDNILVFYGRLGSTLSIYCDGEELL